jgi:hypothetical protein
MYNYSGCWYGFLSGAVCHVESNAGNVFELDQIAVETNTLI